MADLQARQLGNPRWDRLDSQCQIVCAEAIAGQRCFAGEDTDASSDELLHLGAVCASARISGVVECGFDALCDEDNSGWHRMIGGVMSSNLSQHMIHLGVRIHMKYDAIAIGVTAIRWPMRKQQKQECEWR